MAGHFHFSIAALNVRAEMQLKELTVHKYTAFISIFG